MSKPGWEDVTSYSRNGSREPRTFELKTGELRVCVTKHIHFGGWNLICHDLGIKTPRSLGDDLEKAKSKAVRQVRAKLQKMLDSLPEADQ